MDRTGKRAAAGASEGGGVGAAGASAATDKRQEPRTPRRYRWLLLIGVLIVAGGLLWAYRDRLTLPYLASQETRLREFQQAHPVTVYGVAFLVYVAVTGLSLPGATPLSLTYGWYFGLLPGVLLVSFSSTAGATFAFLLSRYLLRDVVERRFRDRLRVFDQRLAREGAFYLFSLRLVVAVPFVMINIVMGLTPMKTWTFWWVSQLGMLPATVVYVYAGSTVPDLQTLADRGVVRILSPQLVIAFALLGLFPLVVRKLLGRFQ